jgi:hypothetical protein
LRSVSGRLASFSSGVHVLVAVEPTLPPLRIGADAREEAGAMEVDVGDEHVERAGVNYRTFRDAFNYGAREVSAMA